MYQNVGGETVCYICKSISDTGTQSHHFYSKCKCKNGLKEEEDN